MKPRGEKIAVLTSYDASFTTRVEEAGADVILVGDSLGGVIHGQATTLSVTMDDMLYHLRHVAYARQQTLLIGDMPYHSYQDKRSALENAKRFIAAGADMVKLEGGSDQRELVETLTRLGIPVCAHLGLQPQRVHKLGGYKVQGRDAGGAEKMLNDALVLEEAGADLLLLECVPAELAKKVTEQVSIPVIGIGACNQTDGQILVVYDILGISAGHVPKFSKNYMTESADIDAAVKSYVAEVKKGVFPSVEHSF